MRRAMAGMPSVQPSPNGPLPAPLSYPGRDGGRNPARPGETGSGIQHEAEPVAGLAENVSPIVRIAPPPLGRLGGTTAGGEEPPGELAGRRESVICAPVPAAIAGDCCQHHLVDSHREPIPHRGGDHCRRIPATSDPLCEGTRRCKAPCTSNPGHSSMEFTVSRRCVHVYRPEWATPARTPLTGPSVLRVPVGCGAEKGIGIHRPAPGRHLEWTVSLDVSCIHAPFPHRHPDAGGIPARSASDEVRARSGRMNLVAGHPTSGSAGTRFAQGFLVPRNDGGEGGAGRTHRRRRSNQVTAREGATAYHALHHTRPFPCLTPGYPPIIMHEGPQATLAEK